MKSRSRSDTRNFPFGLTKQTRLSAKLLQLSAAIDCYTSNTRSSHMIIDGNQPSQRNTTRSRKQRAHAQKPTAPANTNRLSNCQFIIFCKGKEGTAHVSCGSKTLQFQFLAISLASCPLPDLSGPTWPVRATGSHGRRHLDPLVPAPFDFSVVHLVPVLSPLDETFLTFSFSHSGAQIRRSTFSSSRAFQISFSPLLPSSTHFSHFSL